jgi:hypothetical protein
MMYKQVRDTMAQVQGRTQAGVTYPDYYASTREMVTTLMSQGAHPIFMDKMCGLGADAVAHATTVAHLALVMGLRLESYLIQQRPRLSPQHAKEVVNLGVAGMLHDIGKMKLPEALRDRCEADEGAGADAGAAAVDGGGGGGGADVRKQWESHARIGYDMIHGGVESSAAAAVLHHHQHFDGTGFPTAARAGAPGRPAEPKPAPPDGKHIHVFARILYVADLYANLTRPPRPGARRGNLEVLHLMRTRYSPGWTRWCSARSRRSPRRSRPAAKWCSATRRWRPSSPCVRGPLRAGRPPL